MDFSWSNPRQIRLTAKLVLRAFWKRRFAEMARREDELVRREMYLNGEGYREKGVV